VGRGVTHEYQDMFESFTCCVGSGMESHALHGDGIYYESDNQFWVNLYVPSTAEWKAMGASLTMQTDAPIGERARLTWNLKAPRQFTLALRRPPWAGEGFSVSLNARIISVVSPPDRYIEINRVWKDGDTLDLVLPKTLRTEPVPDNRQRVALMWGPLVLAGDLGPEDWRCRLAQTRSGPARCLPHSRSRS
jgi:DUF1680 family protein